MGDREFIRAEDVARILGLSERTVRRMTARRDIPGFRLPNSRVWLYREEAVRAWTAEAEQRHARGRLAAVRPARPAMAPDVTHRMGKPKGAAESHLARIMARRRRPSVTKRQKELMAAQTAK